jgi:hypothetical protein
MPLLVKIVQNAPQNQKARIKIALKVAAQRSHGNTAPHFNGDSRFNPRNSRFRRDAENVRGKPTHAIRFDVQRGGSCLRV